MSVLSIIVPTYNESGNIEPLLVQLTATLKTANIPYEILVMDDNSPDGTAKEVDRVVREHHLSNVSAVVRTTNRGLSPAVIEGFEKAKGDLYLVMDADLSHPISAVPSLYSAITEQGADIAVGSRHCKGGSIVDWPFHRQVVSFGAAMLARPLTSCSDPMAGFFCLRKEVIKGIKLNAAGFKILLEILVKGKFSKMIECPIVFKDREIGVSKLSNKVIVSYITHLIQLYLYPGSAPFFKYLFVGAFGALIDTSIFTLTRNKLFSGKDNFAIVFAFCFSITFNFIMNRLWTFRATNKGDSKTQFFKFVILGGFGLLLRSLLYNFAMSVFGVPNTFPFPQLMLVMVIGVVSVFNFVGSKMWAFK